MKIKELIACLQSFAPFSYQESYDNSGLLVGDAEKDVASALLCLDITEEVLEEAINNQHKLIIAHHPIIFSGLKRLNGKNYVERIIIRAIKEDIALLCVHTNLDNIAEGVNHKIAEKLGLGHAQILRSLTQTLNQLYVYIPVSHSAQVQEALFAAGAGQIGNYSECGFSYSGTGSFKPNEQANPFLGEKNQRHHENEVKLEMTFAAHLKNKIVQALREAHPYEEIAFGIVSLENANKETGAGLIGDLPNDMDVDQFLTHVRNSMKTGVIRHTAWNKKIKKVAICGGSGSFLLSDAIAQGADAFITADFKYHQFFDADKQIMIVDIGHYESEQFTPEIFYQLFTKNFPTFALQITSVNTNPVNYF